MSIHDITEKMNKLNLKYYASSNEQESKRKIKAFENELNINLDEVYKEFVVRYGGSTIQADNVLFPSLEENPVASNNHLRLGLFYGFGVDDADFDVISMTVTYEEQMPDWIIPIADGDGGDQVCLGVKGEATGKVYFWDHELTNGVKDTFLVSNSFSGFIQSLFVQEDSDEEDDGILYIELDDDLLNS
ncbi:SMI1/KNR4 family protein [Bacillus velezensis]|uniref:SMI1/KNR4 family protein n=1 Tax=Bacillus velezensis TaxID=492670 RepID=UPI002DB83BD2|nr:SMI1/KNR4 family protein [Bacillus velezensis]MEC3665133.1 SMI1/KNR4 family protein [Bacillus velezensis]